MLWSAEIDDVSRCCCDLRRYIEEFGWYISGAWDKSIRLWLSENQQNKFSPLYKKKKKDRIGQTPDSPSSPVFQEDDVDVRLCMKHTYTCILYVTERRMCGFCVY